MTTYKEALHKWAEKFLPENTTVVQVHLDMDPGYHYSSWTFEDPHVDFRIEYKYNDEEDSPLDWPTTFIYYGTEDDLPNLGYLLTELFEIADAEDAKK